MYSRIKLAVYEKSEMSKRIIHDIKSKLLKNLEVLKELKGYIGTSFLQSDRIERIIRP